MNHWIISANIHAVFLQKRMYILNKMNTMTFGLSVFVCEGMTGICPTWLVIRLVVILRVGEGEGRVLVAGHSWAAAGLYPPSSGPQLDGSLWRQWALWIWVCIGAGAEGVAPLEESQVGAVGNSSRMRCGSRLTHSQLCQGEVASYRRTQKLHWNDISVSNHHCTVGTGSASTCMVLPG